MEESSLKVFEGLFDLEDDFEDGRENESFSFIVDVTRFNRRRTKKMKKKLNWVFEEMVKFNLIR